jgi:hypothetical protein
MFRVEEETSWQFHAGFLLGLFIDPEFEDMLSEKTVDFQRTARRYIPEGRTLQ